MADSPFAPTWRYRLRSFFLPGGKCPSCQTDVGLWPYLRFWGGFEFPCPQCRVRLTSDGLRGLRWIQTRVLGGLLFGPVVLGLMRGVFGIRLLLLFLAGVFMCVVGFLWSAEAIRKQHPPKRL